MGLVLLIGGCDLKALPGGLPGTGVPQDGVSQTIPFITGQLVDASGAPVEGAGIRAYVAPYRIEGLSLAPVAFVETTTDAKGDFKLVSPPLGSVAVEARGRGLKALRTGVAVTSGAKVELGTLSLQPVGRIVGRVTAASGVSLLGTDVFIPGTDYLSKTADDGSFILQDVPVGSYQLAAVRQSYRPRVVEGVLVAGGQTTTAPDLELSLDAPVITSVNPQSGGAGTIVTLRGENFGASKHTTLQVTFGDSLATILRRVSDTEIEATVPAGATSHGVVVSSNGVASAPLLFRVVASLRVFPSMAGIYPGATASFRIEARDERGEPIPAPFVAWALGDPQVGSLDARGEFDPTGTGVSSITLSSGLTTARAWVGVSPYRMSTMAGNGLPGVPQEGAQAASDSLGYPDGIAVGPDGNVYVASGVSRRIWKIDPAGRVTHLAGAGSSGSAGDNGPATQAAFGSQLFLAVDARNRLWISDTLNHVVRFVPLDARDEPAGWHSGHIYRAAGTGADAYSGSGLPGPQSALSAPRQLAPGPEGVYVADMRNQRIRLITPELRLIDVLGNGQQRAMETQGPETEATFALPESCAIDRSGNMMIGDRYRLLFWCRVSGSYYGRRCEAGQVYPLVGQTIENAPFVGDVPLVRSMISSPGCLAFDSSGSCWLVEKDRPVVRRLTMDGRLETVAGDAEAAATGRSATYQGEGVCALEATIGKAIAFAFLGDDLLVTDAAQHRIRRLVSAGP